MKILKFQISLVEFLEIVIPVAVWSEDVPSVLQTGIVLQTNIAQDMIAEVLMKTTTTIITIMTTMITMTTMTTMTMDLADRIRVAVFQFQLEIPSKDSVSKLYKNNSIKSSHAIV